MNNKIIVLKSFNNEIEKVAFNPIKAGSQMIGALVGAGSAVTAGTVKGTIGGFKSFGPEFVTGLKRGFSTVKGKTAQTATKPISSQATGNAGGIGETAINDIRGRIAASPTSVGGAPPPGVMAAPVGGHPTGTGAAPIHPVSPTAATPLTDTAVSQGNIAATPKQPVQPYDLSKVKKIAKWGLIGAGTTAGIVGAGTVWGGLTMEPGMNAYMSGEGPSAQGPVYGA
jgi:hypothetical protein